MNCTRRLECALLDRRDAGSEGRVREALVMVKRIAPWDCRKRMEEAILRRDWELACARVLDSALEAMAEKRKCGKVSSEDVGHIAVNASRAIGEALVSAYLSGDAGKGHAEWEEFCRGLERKISESLRDTIFFSSQERLEISRVTDGEKNLMRFIWLFAEGVASQKVAAMEAARKAERAPAA